MLKDRRDAGNRSRTWATDFRMQSSLDGCGGHSRHHPVSTDRVCRSFNEVLCLEPALVLRDQEDEGALGDHGLMYRKEIAPHVAGTPNSVHLRVVATT